MYAFTQHVNKLTALTRQQANMWVQDLDPSEPVRTLSSISIADADLTETGAALRNTDCVLPAAAVSFAGPLVPEAGSDLLNRPGSSPLPVSKMLRMVSIGKLVMHAFCQSAGC